MGIKENFQQAVRELTGGGRDDSKRDKSINGMKNAVAAADDTSEFPAITPADASAIDEIGKRAAAAADEYTRQQSAYTYQPPEAELINSNMDYESETDEPISFGNRTASQPMAQSMAQPSEQPMPQPSSQAQPQEPARAPQAPAMSPSDAYRNAPPPRQNNAHRNLVQPSDVYKANLNKQRAHSSGRPHTRSLREAVEANAQASPENYFDQGGDPSLVYEQSQPQPSRPAQQQSQASYGVQQQPTSNYGGQQQTGYTAPQQTPNYGAQQGYTGQQQAPNYGTQQQAAYSQGYQAQSSYAAEAAAQQQRAAADRAAFEQGYNAGFNAGSRSRAQAYRDTFGYAESSPTFPNINRQQTSEEDETTVISRNTVIDGNIRSFANMSVDGNIKGNVETTKDMDVNGKIVGNIACNNARMRTSQIQGNIQMKGSAFMERETLLIGDLTSNYANVNGKIKGNLAISGKAELKSDAVVFGDISASTITVNDGAIIQGYVRTTFLNKEESKNIFPDTITIGD